MLAAWCAAALAAGCGVATRPQGAAVAPAYSAPIATAAPALSVPNTATAPALSPATATSELSPATPLTSGRAAPRPERPDQVVRAGPDGAGAAVSAVLAAQIATEAGGNRPATEEEPAAQPLADEEPAAQPDGTLAARPALPAAMPTVAPTQPPRRDYRLPIQAADVAPAPAPGERPLVASPALATLVQQQLGSLRGVYGVAIKALDSGQGVLLNADREFPAASLFKLPVMYEVFRQRDAGQLDLAERLVLTAHYAELDLGTLDLPIGSAVSIDAALQRMIAISDNATANLLADRVGWPSLNATARDLGLGETHLGGDRLTTSPRDMMRLLDLIARGREPSPASAAAMIELLLGQRVNDRLPAQLPPGTRVAHKTGNLEGVVHDVGIVYAPDAPFVIALLAEDTGDYGQVVQAQAALTRAVYDYLSAAAAASTPTATPLPSPTAVPPMPTARRWRPPATTPVVLPTAHLWQSPTATATPTPRPTPTPRGG